MNEDRYHRQILLFGESGQREIASTNVAVVGVGGLGSHVVQQLSYLGVRSFALIDSDIVSVSNLNRLIGARMEDAEAGRMKVDVISDLVRNINSDAGVEVLETSFINEEGFNIIKAVDFVFGCIDSDADRLVLNELCQVTARPYLDVATDTDETGGLSFGGRMLFSVGGELCLICTGMLSQTDIRQELSSSTQREEEARIYGVPHKDAESGPSVVSLNGILASVAVTEFMVETAGIRRAERSLEYNGQMGRLLRITDPPSNDCYFCKGIYGSQDLTDVRRFFKE